MREHVQFQTFRPRLPEVYDAPAHDYLLLRAPRVGGATYWDGQKKSVKGCWSTIGLLLRML